MFDLWLTCGMLFLCVLVMMAAFSGGDVFVLGKWTIPAAVGIVLLGPLNFIAIFVLMVSVA